MPRISGIIPGGGAAGPERLRIFQINRGDVGGTAREVARRLDGGGRRTDREGGSIGGGAGCSGPVGWLPTTLE